MKMTMYKSETTALLRRRLRSLCSTQPSAQQTDCEIRLRATNVNSHPIIIVADAP